MQQNTEIVKSHDPLFLNFVMEYPNRMQAILTLHTLRELQENGVASLYLLHDSEFIFFLLLKWLSPTTGEPNPPC